MSALYEDIENFII